MASKFTYDFENRLLIVSSSITELDVQVDLYSDWKEDVITTVFNPGVVHPFRTTAGDPIGGGNKISPYFFLINGWKIRPQEANHTLTIRGNLYTDPAGQDIIIPTSGAYTVNAVLERAVDSTAVLLNEPVIQHASFGEGVWVNPSSPYAGTTFPIGTLLQPVNNVSDALSILVAQGLPNMYLLGSVEFVDEDISGIEIFGKAPEVTIIVHSGVNIDNTQFEDLIISGSFMQSGPPAETVIKRSRIENLTSYSGKLAKDVRLAGVMFLSGSGPISFLRAYDFDTSFGAATFDLSDIYSGAQIGVRDYFGALKIVSCSTDVDMAIDIRGRLIFDSTVTSGSFIVRGIGQVDDQSTGTALINTDDLIGSEVKTEISEIITSQSLVDGDFDTVITSQSIADTKLNSLLSVSGSGLTPAQAEMLLGLYEIMGLDPTQPLIVTPVARTVSSSISQSITTSGDEVTVTRTV